MYGPGKIYYYFCKLNFPLINLVFNSGDMIQVSKNTSF